MGFPGSAIKSLVFPGLLLLLSSGFVRAAPPAPINGGLAANANVDEILDALDQRGKTLHDFTANVKLIETSDPALGISKTRTGQVWFAKKADNDARLRIVLDKLLKGRMLVNDKIEYLLDGGWLTDRNYQKKEEVKRQVVQQGQKVNLLKLGEGPFPLPIGQSKEDVHKNFEVTKAAPAPTDPPNTLHLSLKPNPGTPLAKRLRSLDVWVDRASHMPVRIDTTDAATGEQRETDLTDVKINAPGGLKDADFTLSPIDSDWSRTTEPFKG